MYEITPEQPQDHAAIEKLLDKSFGEDRFKKTAYALRQNSNSIPELCLVAREAGNLLASIQYWHLKIAGEVPALLLGPIAVQPERQGEGIGVGLIRDTLQLAKSLGHKIVILVGDPAYYGRFGFSSAFEKGLELPGPVEAHRFLVCELEDGALDNVKGLVTGHKALSDLALN
ncbi:GNAT family N-acetyltransferase [Sneathiella glossodoripedis]|uniref:GNAT family N-acetyltransferase n=1 Tax=Sneathiella glossodoripedis TaxID=418853 RepID=UPI00046EC1D1|nr:N-acetyltransferase [Sneathiella glossodoripedis]